MITFLIILSSLFFLFWIRILFLKLKSYLHILQLEAYSTSKLKNWVKENRILFYRKNKNTKKPFVYTARAKRLIFILYSLILISFIIFFTLLYTLFNFIEIHFIYLAISIFILFMCISFFTSVYYIYLANYISLYIENRINNWYFNIAREKIRKLRDKGLITVGITGSYGKTSVKFISAAILSQKFRVLSTPESYNTPMGLSKVINNDLNEDYEIFIAEMGATRNGDIEELVELTGPQIGLITSIGACHLESFGSILNVAKTKYELIRGLPDIGIAIFNNDNTYLRELARITNKRKILYAIENIEDADIYAKDISVNEEGSSFTLCIKGKGEIACKTSLLGKHNILNILAAVSIAHVFGMNFNEISMGIKNILPVKHRLELIDPKTGILVIDDAYNSNPDGAEAALEVLGEFKDRRKIIVTPGMVELGEFEKFENNKFGERIAEICDIAILIGKKRTEPIYNGLISSGFNKNNVYVVNSTNDSTEIIKSIAKHGDVILYENDLPDNYDES